MSNSPLPHFHFYQKVNYYKSSDFPESVGYFLGILDHVGTSKTFTVLDEFTLEVVYCQVIRPFKHTGRDPRHYSDPPRYKYGELHVKKLLVFSLHAYKSYIKVLYGEQSSPSLSDDYLLWKYKYDGFSIQQPLLFWAGDTQDSP